MIKKFIAAVLCVALAVTVVGCNKKDSPAKLARKLTNKITQAKYIDSNVDANIDVISQFFGTQTLKINGNLKFDNSSEFAKLLIDGTLGLENMQNTPAKFYMDEKNAYLNIMNQQQQIPVPDQIKQNMKSINKFDSLNDNIGKHIEEIEHNGKPALKTNYDIQQINSAMSATNSSEPGTEKKNIDLTKIDLLYVLSEDKENINEIILDLGFNNNGQSMSFYIHLTINSIDQPFQITPPETNENSGATQQAA